MQTNLLGWHVTTKDQRSGRVVAATVSINMTLLLWLWIDGTGGELACIGQAQIAKLLPVEAEKPRLK